MAKRKTTAQQKLNNFLRSDVAKTYPLCSMKRLILHALASYCYYNLECNPSLNSICDYTGIKKTEVISHHLSELAAICLIEIVRKKGVRNKYIWLIPDIPDEEIYRKKSVDKIGKTTKPPPPKGGSNHPLQKGVVH